MLKEGSKDVPEDVITRESSSAYQSDVFTRRGEPINKAERLAGL
jgi:hypothetical protein